MQTSVNVILIIERIAFIGELRCENSDIKLAENLFLILIPCRFGHMECNSKIGKIVLFQNLTAGHSIFAIDKILQRTDIGPPLQIGILSYPCRGIENLLISGLYINLNDVRIFGNSHLRKKSRLPFDRQAIAVYNPHDFYIGVARFPKIIVKNRGFVVFDRCPFAAFSIQKFKINSQSARFHFIVTVRYTIGKERIGCAHANNSAKNDKQNRHKDSCSLILHGISFLGFYPEFQFAKS